MNQTGAKREVEYKVGDRHPPLEHRFSSTNQPANPGRKKGSVCMTDLLRKYLEKKIDFKDPITKREIKKKFKDIIILRLMANAISGNQRAIDEVLNRIDGVKQSEALIFQNILNNITNEYSNLSDAELIDQARARGINLPDSIEQRVGEEGEK